MWRKPEVVKGARLLISPWEELNRNRPCGCDGPIATSVKFIPEWLLAFGQTGREGGGEGGRGDTRWDEKATYSCHSAVDLCSILALWVRVLWGGHLQHAHSKGIHIHWLVVLLLIHLRRHELRGTLNQNNRSELAYFLTDWVGFSQPRAPLRSSNPWRVEEEKDVCGCLLVLNLRSEKGGREREERGEKGEGSKKEKRRERLGSVRL